METKLYEIKVTLSDDQKENISSSFIHHKFTQIILKSDALTGNDTLIVPRKSLKMDLEEGNVLDEKTFHEMHKNNYLLVRSGLENFKLFTPPTVVESLEKARENNKGMVIDLDYTDLNYSTGLAVMKNIVKNFVSNDLELNLYEMNVTLSNFQKEKVREAFENREDIRLLLTKEALRGSDTILVPHVSHEELDDIPNGTDAIVDESTYDEMFKEAFPDGFSAEIEQWENMWKYFGFPFTAGIHENFESKGVEFSLNYSLITNFPEKYVIKYSRDKYVLVER